MGSFAAVLCDNGASAQVIQDFATSDTLLHVAIKSGHVSGASFLVQRGADLNHVNVKGQTSLHLAAENDDMSLLVELMLRSKANPNLQTKAGAAVAVKPNNDGPKKSTKLK